MIPQRETSSDDNPVEYEHSRSSSVGDIPVGMNGIDHRMATPDGYAALPYDSTLPSSKPQTNGVAKRTKRCGAVRVDLSFADTSIRRPGSAPDLINNDDVCTSKHSPGGNSVRSGQKSDRIIDRGRSTSSERDLVLKKLGAPGTPGTRKVAFAGIESDDESDDTDSDQETVNSFDEEIWVKQPEAPKPPVEESVAISGVVIAGAQPQQNSCNGNAIR